MVLSDSRKKATPFKNAGFLGRPASANSDSLKQEVQLQRELLGVVCGHTVAACLLARTLKHHRIVARNTALASTSAMSLEFQKYKYWVGSSLQSHGFNPPNIV